MDESTSSNDVSIHSADVGIAMMPTRKSPADPPSRRPLPPPSLDGDGGFHPDFLFCGQCTDCSTGESDAPPSTFTGVPPGVATNLPDDTMMFCAPIDAKITDDDSDQINDDEGHNASGSSDSYLIQTHLQLTRPCSGKQDKLLLESLLKPIKGVKHVELDDIHRHNRIYIHHNATSHAEDFCRVLIQGGFPAQVMEADSRNSSSTSDNRSEERHPEARKSTFFVKGICCASEVPSIRKIVRPMPGVISLQINITTKRVYVQHEVTRVSAQDIAQRLAEQGFPASILQNGGQQLSPKASSLVLDGNQSTVGRTILHIAQSDFQERDATAIQQSIAPLEGVRQVNVDVAESVVAIEHDFTIISVSRICEHLSSQKYKATLIQDAQALLEQMAETNAILSQPRSKYVESTIYMSNLTTGHLPVLAKAISQQYIRPQVRAVHPHVTSRTAKVEHNPQLVSIHDICDVLKQFGLDCSVVTDGQVENLILPLLEEEDEATEDAKTNAVMAAWQSSQLSTYVILSGIFWVIALIGSVEESLGVLQYAGWLSVFFGLPPVAIKASRTIRRCEFDANCMMVTAAIGALLLGELDEAASVAFLFSVSEYLETKATDKARTALAAIVQLRPEHANLIHPETKEIVVVPADRVPVGSLISVRTGDKVAADGVVVEGTSQIDESSLTGESVPVTKKINDPVSGGGINVGSVQLVIRTTTSVEDSAVSRLIRLVEEAQANRSPTEKMIDGFARAYTPAVLVVAVVMCTVPWLWGTEVGKRWMLNGLIIIVIACPCALTISTPVTYSAGLAATAQRGVIVKGGSSLEALGGVETVLFDKTGTLTEGKFKILHLNEIGVERKYMLELLAIMEASSSHPLSATLVTAVKHEIGSISPAQISEHTILKGEGVTARVDTRQVYVGNNRLFGRIGMYDKLSDECKRLANEWNSTGVSVGFIGVEGEGIIGMFCVSDIVRPEAQEVVETLINESFDVQMLTGDGEGAALSVAHQVGITSDCVRAKLLPEDKLHYVRRAKAPASKKHYGLFRRKPQVLFIGDGVNDAPALTTADIGVSMGEGASLAMEMSDVTLMDSNLHKLVYVIKMGRRTVFTIQENILMSLACKILVVVLTFLGYMTLMYAIASDVGVMLLVTLNGMKLLPGNPEHGGLGKLRKLGRRRGYSGVPQNGGGATLSRQQSFEDNEDDNLV